MSVSVYFEHARATIPQGARFYEPPDLPNRIRVLDENGNTIAVVSMDAMQMIEIDAEEPDDADDTDAAATPSAD